MNSLVQPHLPVACARTGPVLAFVDGLEAEVARALRYDRPLSVAWVRVPPARWSPAQVRPVVEAALRRVDRWIDDEAGMVLVALPEVSATADVPVRRIVARLAELGVPVQAGIARCPLDGSDAAALLASAFGAAGQAEPGTVAFAEGGDGRTVRVGAQRYVAVDLNTRRLFREVRDLARSLLPVLVLGETGVGKEVVAQALHAWSPRSAGPFRAINCSALPETLLESELFGHVKGAFSGATADRVGLVEACAGGTLFLDEIGEASLRTQAGLLRVLETREVRRLGAVDARKVDVRFVSATNVEPAVAVATGRLRADLYYRLAAAAVRVPPLRARPEDLPELVSRLLARAFARGEGVEWHDGAAGGAAGAVPRLDDAALARLLAHDWPGNVRELVHYIDRLAATAHRSVITVAELPPFAELRLGGSQTGPPGARSGLPGDPPGGPPGDTDSQVRFGAHPGGLGRRPEALPAVPSGVPGEFRPLSDEIAALEEKRIRQALAHTGGARNRAAALLSMPLRTFVERLRRYGINSGGAP